MGHLPGRDADTAGGASDVPPTLDAFRAAAPLPERVGPYRVLERLGEGGMGTVYKAEQRSPIKRTVALKVIRLGLGTTEVLARFESERQALARMNHPNVARVLDAGVDDRGCPYFAMEYVPGEPITEFADRNKLSITQRLELFQQVCDAIAHAHTKSLLHRDIKPSNVLAYMDEGRPAVKVIDFGIAKALTGDRLTDRTFNTQRGLAIGTYESMSPEQADGSPDIDTRTDVYSLGVLLYELLTGVKPFDEQVIRRAADDEIRRMIREVDPPRPSTRLTSLVGDTARTIAAARQEQVDVLSRQLRRELDWIPLKAMRKERDRRYASPLALAEDIQNYLDAKPLVAAPDSVAYRLNKLVRRNKALIASLAAVFVVLLLGVAATTAGFVAQSRARAEAERQREETEREAYFAAISAATAALDQGEIPLARQLLGEAAPTLRGWEWAYLQAQTDTSSLTLGGHSFPVVNVEFSPDGKALTTRSPGSTIVFNAANGAEVSRGNNDQGAVFSPDGTRVAEACAVDLDKKPAVRVSDARSGREVALLRGHAKDVVCVAFSPDGRRLATGSADHTARVWDAASGRELASLKGHAAAVNAIAFSPDGARVATASADGTARTWDEAGSKASQMAVMSGHAKGVRCVAFSHDGTRTVTGSEDQTARVWDAATGAQVAVLRGPRLPVRCVAFSPDGARVAAGAGDAIVRLWEVSGAREVGVFRGHADAVLSVAFSPDGTRLAAGSEDTTARVWDIPTPITGNCVAFSPDGRRLATTAGNAARVWDLATGVPLAELRGHEATARAVTFSPDGSRLATASDDKTARLWDVATTRELAVLRGHKQPLTTLAFSADGMKLVTAGRDNTQRMWDAADGREIRVMGAGKTDEPDPTRAAWSAAVAFSGDGRQLATASETKPGEARVQLREGATGERTGGWPSNMGTSEPLAQFEGPIDAMAFSPDARRLAVASLGGRVFDLGSGQRALILSGYRQRVRAIAFSPDGKQLATGSDDHTVRLWNADTGRPLLVLRGHESAVTSVAFSPDGTQLASASDDQTVRFWDTVPAAKRYKARGPWTPASTTAQPSH
jgi:WD40 repeat protein/serine/threonine protein kinase